MRITISLYQDPDVEVELQKIDVFGEPRRWRINTIIDGQVNVIPYPATAETEAHEAYDRIVSKRLEAIR